MTHLAGRNGTGKSTLVELVAGYLRPWSGSVLVNGHPAHRPEARKGRRVTRSTVSLYHDMTVADHLAFTARTGDEPAAELDRLRSRADAYGLGPWMETAAGALSTGNARKLWLLVTTPGRPLTMVLDEPFEGLDDQGAGVLVDELRAWAAERLVVLVAHDLPSGLEPGRRVELAPLRGGEPRADRRSA